MRECYTPKLCQSFLNDRSLSDIKKQVEQRQRIEHFVRKQLPDPISKQVSIASYHQGVLTLSVPSAPLLMRLKYEHGRLLSAIRSDLFPHLSSIQYRINPKQNQSVSLKSKSTSFKPASLSPESCELLSHLAEDAPEPLKKALLKLTQTGKK